MSDTTPKLSDALLKAWRTARNSADEQHRKAMQDADELYEQWLAAQQAEAARGAALPTATWEDRFAALQVLGEASVRMRKPGDWYVDQRVGVSNGAIVRSSYGNGATPQEAVEDHWLIYSAVGGNEWIASGSGDDRINAVWDGDAWKTWKPERVTT